MENEKTILMEKIMHFAMLLRRLSAPKVTHEGPRGRSQERALTQIALRDGISQRELLEKLGIQPSSLSELLGKLEKGGMIERKPNEDDRRQTNIYINETGKRYLERVNDSDRQLIPFDALTDDEQAELGRLVGKLIESAENACADQGLPMYPPRPRPFEGGGDARGRHCPPPPHGRPPFERNHFGNGTSPFGDEKPPFEGRPPFGGERPLPAERGNDFSPESRGHRPHFGEGGGFEHRRPPFGGPVRLPNIRPHDGDEGDNKPINPVQLADNGESEKI